MFRNVNGLLCISAGLCGLTVAWLLGGATRSMAQPVARYGPCEQFVGGPCRCTDSGSGYFYYCAEYHWDTSWCQNTDSFQACEDNDQRQCFTDLETWKVHCSESTCVPMHSRDCEPLDGDTCKLWTRDCLHSL